MLTSAWVRARQRTNQSHVQVHDLKHTLAVDCVRPGCSLRTDGIFSAPFRTDHPHCSAAELTRLIEAANGVCSASNEDQGLVVMRGALARVPKNSRKRLEVSLKILVPRGGIEPPTP